MAKVWVLDTETKGTGAEMIPLEKAHDGTHGGRSAIVVRERKPPRPKAAVPAGPRRFRIVDVMTRRVLGEDLPLAQTVGILKAARSIVDIDLAVWEPKAARWQALSHREKRMLWDLRERET